MSKFTVETDGFPTEIIDDVEVCIYKLNALINLNHNVVNRRIEGPTYYLVCMRGTWPYSGNLKASMSVQPIKTIQGEIDL